MQEYVELKHRGMKIRGTAHIPDQENKTFPAVVLFHGLTGSRNGNRQLLFVKICRALEKRGIASFRFDFLGSGESDGNFEEMTVSKEIEEANSILDFVQSHPSIDSENISLLGYSLGGVIASVIAGNRPHDIKKVTLLSPAGNFHEMDVMKPLEQFFLAYPNAGVLEVDGYLFGRDFVVNALQKNVYVEAKSFQGDVLLIHGTSDEVSPFQISQHYRDHSFGGRCNIHLIEGADHAFSKVKWEIEIIERIVNFF